MQLTALPALSDNYIWTLAAPNGRTVVVDPGEAGPVLAALEAPPAALLLTHHHADHVGGVPELLRRWPGLPVYAPRDERIPMATHVVGHGDTVTCEGFRFDVLAVPGHTVSHIAFYGHDHLFCGDTLFSLGCGRLFEGTPAAMLESLERLSALPATTRVCCGHEYTRDNAAFARAVEPGNQALRRRSQDIETMRERGRPTLPSTLSDELACNPFLRIDASEVRAALVGRLPDRTEPDRVALFAALRRWKDDFRA